ncbi:hypothetical protein TPHA_0O01730 [Tetrapisispora phaffii CBS 4417]|uniref:Septin-type G domain-containing protein n=1 Tax=Tetrapisispora phaffii (strain ATCC 24235 / CBS 4417 / NBRC 1672 / NRRL Y-8282 / UCD 70-5) TaxID=1071381 RepID=G8C1W2_TETPH|nr:hypothetical protein TPHA_0O01730 [Tetrapisispora phaffii CBS 4417]CCE66140.1 hypothetical protein TPHA_0O01730 [Tetrapisispora phaffii CBS 4417]
MSEFDSAKLARRKKENKRGIAYSVLLCGRDGLGKTTFANNLLESNIFTHKYNTSAESDLGSSVGPENERIKIIKPTKVVSYNSKNGIPTFMSDLDAKRANFEPGVTITSTTVDINTSSDAGNAVDDDEDTIILNIVNTHGLGENLDDTLCFDELTNYLEQQFDIVLAEETRIRRNPRFEDTRVHVIVYFIEPTGHGLQELDIELMKRLSNYANVLPVIAKGDSFTKEEMKTFKKNILKDIDYFNIPVYQFKVDEDEDDLETIEENQILASLQPFSIICSDVRDSDGNYIRSYPWGTVIIDSYKNKDKGNNSELEVVKNVLFGSHLQEFKDTTQNLLYENYRAEKLSSVASPQINASKPSTFAANSGNPIDRNSTVPSLSNFTSFVNTGKFASQQTLALVEQDSTPENDKSNASKFVGESIEESPIKQMSQTLKHHNEEIIKNIKKEAPNMTSPDMNEKSKLRNMSETVPYVLRHERIIARQQKLEELEAQSAKELQKRIQDLEKKAQTLKLKEKLLRQEHLERAQGKESSQSSLGSAFAGTGQLKKEETLTDLASIVSGQK